MRVDESEGAPLLHGLGLGVRAGAAGARRVDNGLESNLLWIPVLVLARARRAPVSVLVQLVVRADAVLLRQGHFD